MLEEYRYTQRFRVPFADIDMLRHVNNAAYIRWAEQIRCDYFAEVLGEDIRGERGIIMARLEIHYEVAVLYREHVALGCRISRIGRKSLDFSYEIWSEDRNVRCTHALTPVVAMNYATGETIVVPDSWRAKVAAFERPEVTVD
jgi:acyl-CoA thioester hydrolase